MLYYPRIVLVLSGGLLIGCVKERPVTQDYLIVLVEDPTLGEDDTDCAAAPPVADTLMRPCRPNPFCESTSIGFEMRRAGSVTLEVYDLAGRLLAVLINGHRMEGTHEAIWRGRDTAGREAPVGVYVARLSAANRHESRRMVLMR